MVYTLKHLTPSRELPHKNFDTIEYHIRFKHFMPANVYVINGVVAEATTKSLSGVTEENNYS
jgi:hypothetical protein